MKTCSGRMKLHNCMLTLNIHGMYELQSFPGSLNSHIILHLISYILLFDAVDDGFRCWI
jgi:hypothetical protein